MHPLCRVEFSDCTGVSSRLKQLWCGIITMSIRFYILGFRWKFVASISIRPHCTAFSISNGKSKLCVCVSHSIFYLIIWVYNIWSATAFTIGVYQFNFLVIQYAEICTYAILENAFGKILKVLLRPGDIIKIPINFVCNQFRNIPKIWIAISSLSYGFLPCKLYQSFSLIQEFKLKLFVSLLAFYLMHIAHICVRCSNAGAQLNACAFMYVQHSVMLVSSKMVIFTLISLIESKQERNTTPGTVCPEYLVDRIHICFFVYLFDVDT